MPLIPIYLILEWGQSIFMDTVSVGDCFGVLRVNIYVNA